MRLIQKMQKAFADAYLKPNGNGPEAALAAYNYGSRNSARVMAYNGLHSQQVLAYFESSMASVRKVWQRRGNPESCARQQKCFFYPGSACRGVVRSRDLVG